MNRPRFLDFRASRLAKSVGLCQTDIPSLAGMVNEAMDRLLIDQLQPDEGWYGTWIKMLFNVSQAQPFITSPRGVARLIVMDVCKVPVKIQNGFYEFLDFGRGIQPSGCAANVASSSGLLQSPCNQLLQAYDRETVPTLAPLLSTPQAIRIFLSDPRDVGKTVIVQGADSNNITVLGTDALTGAAILGEVVTLNVPFVDTVNTFSTITGIQKDMTYGPITFFQVDPSSLTVSSLSVMEPSETVGNYRRYMVNGLPANCCNVPGGQVQVTAMAKLEFVPVISDPDYLIIPNVPALIAECERIRYLSMDTTASQTMAAAKHLEALSLLFGQLDHYLGKERPAINVPIFGSDRLRAQPI